MADRFDIAPAYRDRVAALGWNEPSAIFRDDRLRVWRDLPDRDNSTLDVDGVRFHIKRDKRKRREPMALEAAGITLLNNAGVATAPLVASGELADGRTFVVTENLDEFLSADRAIERGANLANVTDAMIDVAARLHRGGLHHRDLYANHFYLRPTGDGFDVRLIDTARVRRLPRFFRERWIVKDVAQLLFSLFEYLPTPAERDGIITRYQAATGRSPGGWFGRRVRSKATWIERHDRSLRESAPKRNLRLADGN